MQLRHATLIGVLILGLVSCWVYLRVLSPGNTDRGSSGLQASPQRLAAPAGDRSATNDTEIAALRGEVTSLRAELFTLRGQQVSARSASTNAGGQASGESQAGADDPRSSPPVREEAARERQARIAVIDSAFRREIIDPTWSANTSSAIQSALASDDVGGIQADNIDCRSQSCRVELHDDGSGRLAKSLPLFVLQLAGTVSTMTANTIPQSGGGSTLVLYLSHQGEAAPSR